MSFSGQIEDFAVTDILQYVHTSKKSGTLTLKKGSDYGWAFFQDGQIVQAGWPAMANLGNLLLIRKHISPSDLDEAVRIQKNGHRSKPLGMILKEMGAITHHELKEAVISQIEQVVYELVSWEEGSFRFEQGDHELKDDIAVTPEDLIPPEEIDTKNLLVEAIRIFKKSADAKSQFRERPLAFSEEQSPGRRDGGTMLKAQDIALDSDQEGTENLLRSLPFLQQMLLEGRKKDGPQSISLFFLKVLAEHLDRAILFLVRRGELLGLGAFGKTCDQQSLDKTTKNMRIPLERDSMLWHCIHTASPFQGEPLPQSWLETLHHRIGAPANPRLIVLPVVGIERIICMVYGDNGRLARPPLHTELLEIAAGQAGIIFENVSLRNQVRRKAS